MNSLEAGALGNPVLAGKNRLKETAGAEAIRVLLVRAGLDTAKKPKRTFDRFDGCD